MLHELPNICILDYLTFDTNDNLALGRKDFMVGHQNRPMLENLKGLGIALEYNGSKTQGIRIIHTPTKTVIGEVTVSGNPNWLSELMHDLKILKSNPIKYIPDYHP